MTPSGTSHIVWGALCHSTSQGRELAIVDISKVTSIISDDVIDTMTRLGLLKYSDGEHHIIGTPVCEMPPFDRGRV